GFRESEFNRRLQGETYEQIAASGGGIASTVHATRQASEEQLAENVLARARTMAAYGTTTAEAKSGYGLDVACELKQLRAIRDELLSDVRPLRAGPAAHRCGGDRVAVHRLQPRLVNDRIDAGRDAAGHAADAHDGGGVAHRRDAERRVLPAPRARDRRKQKAE